MGNILLEQRPSVGIWGGLWSFPELDNAEDAVNYCNERFGTITDCESKPSFRHTFSHYHLDITPVYISIAQTIRRIADNDRQRWLKCHQWKTLGLPAPVKKLLDSF